MKKYPISTQLKIILETHAEKIIEGEPEFVFHKGWLDIYWPPGELEFIRLVENKTLKNFYDECYKILNTKYSKKYKFRNFKKGRDLNNLLTSVLKKK